MHSASKFNIISTLQTSSKCSEIKTVLKKKRVELWGKCQYPGSLYIINVNSSIPCVPNDQLGSIRWEIGVTKNYRD